MDQATLTSLLLPLIALVIGILLGLAWKAGSASDVDELQEQLVALREALENREQIHLEHQQIALQLAERLGASGQELVQHLRTRPVTRPQTASPSVLTRDGTAGPENLP
jgi:uncharacterized membrane-anchored protein YhcB (DUF1043 family)